MGSIPARRLCLRGAVRSARRFVTAEVMGSNPIEGVRGDVAQLVEASVLETEGCGFDSHGHHIMKFESGRLILISHFKLHSVL